MRITVKSFAKGVSTAVVCMSLLFSFSVRAYGQSQTNFMMSMSAGLNSSGWEWDLSIQYNPMLYVGFKCTLGMAGEIQAFEDWSYDWYEGDWYYDGYDKDYAVRFKFMPGVELRTPTIIDWKSQEATIHLFANPALVLSPGARGSHKPTWCCWQVRAGVELDLGELVFQLGYGITSFNLYSGRPWNENGLPDDTEALTHSGFISIGYRF